MSKSFSAYALFRAVWQPALHTSLVCFCSNRCAAVLADIFRVVADQAVALAGEAEPTYAVDEGRVARAMSGEAAAPLRALP